jgi:hypothetical protein
MEMILWTREWRPGVIGLAMVVMLCGVGYGGPPRALPGSQSSCTGIEHRSFDFWAGDWDVFDAATGSKTAHVRVERVLNGCALREEYKGADGNEGESLSSYDAAHSVWRQHWVSNHGQIVVLEGGITSGAMVLQGTEQGTHAPDLVRGSWKPEGGNVRETAERSGDGGKTWQPWFDLEFRPSHLP